MEAGQRALLHRLFPDVAVETAAFPIWVDQFEGQAQLKIENTKNQVHVHCTCTYTEEVSVCTCTYHSLWLLQ